MKQVDPCHVSRHSTRLRRTYLTVYANAAKPTMTTRLVMVLLSRPWGCSFVRPCGSRCVLRSVASRLPGPLCCVLQASSCSCRSTASVNSCSNNACFLFYFLSSIFLFVRLLFLNQSTHTPVIRTIKLLKEKVSHCISAQRTLPSMAASTMRMRFQLQRHVRGDAGLNIVSITIHSKLFHSIVEKWAGNFYRNISFTAKITHVSRHDRPTLMAYVVLSRNGEESFNKWLRSDRDHIGGPRHVYNTSCVNNFKSIGEKGFEWRARTDRQTDRQTDPNAQPSHSYPRTRVTTYYLYFMSRYPSTSVLWSGTHSNHGANCLSTSNFYHTINLNEYMSLRTFAMSGKSSQNILSFKLNGPLWQASCRFYKHIRSCSNISHIKNEDKTINKIKNIISLFSLQYQLYYSYTSHRTPNEIAFVMNRL